MKAPFLLPLLLFLFHTISAKVSIKQLELVYGNHQVGFTHYIATDSSRTYQRIYDWTNQHIPRPIPVSIWYPADVNNSQIDPLKVVDYMRILKEEEEWEHLPDDQILNWFYYPNTPANQKHLQESTAAFFEIEPASSKYPVIIYAPSYQASSIENFVLCEFLASYGYVVLSSPSRGAMNRFFEGGTEKDMETQARDIEFLLEESARFSYVDEDNIATMGFSFGGLSQILSKMRDSRIKAIVSLDGSVNYQYATLKESSFHKIENIQVPFIHFSQKKIPSIVLQEDKIDSSLNTNFEFFDELTYSEAYHFKFHNLTHSYFSSLGVLFQPRDLRQDKSDAEIMESYRWVSQYTLNFLNGYLKKDSAGVQFLNREPIENIQKAGIITKIVKPALTSKFSFQQFNDLAMLQSYTNLDQLYDSLVDLHPNFKIEEGNLNNLGLQLVFNPHKASMGIKVFVFATSLFPQSANLWDSLAEGYLHLGKKKEAVESFEKSLQLNSGNENAIRRLEELKKNY